MRRILLYLIIASLRVFGTEYIAKPFPRGTTAKPTALDCSDANNQQRFPICANVIDPEVAKFSSIVRIDCTKNPTDANKINICKTVNLDEQAKLQQLNYKLKIPVSSKTKLNCLKPEVQKKHSKLCKHVIDSRYWAAGTMMAFDCTDGVEDGYEANHCDSVDPAMQEWMHKTEMTK
jgi:hypothetical protein